MKTLRTAEDLLRLSGQGRFELVRGEVVEIPLVGGSHGGAAVRAAMLLGKHVRAHGLGEVVVETGFFLRRGPDTVRGPDVSFFSLARLPEGGLPEGFMDAPPDLALEVVSPNDTSQELEARILAFLEAGVGRIWVLYPRTRTLHDWRADGTVRVLSAGQEVDGEPEVPGFRAEVRAFFA